MPRLLSFFLITVILIGISLRFHALGSKVLWHDETVTVIRTSGQSRQDVLSYVRKQVAWTTPRQLTALQQERPNSSLSEDLRAIINSSLSASPSMPLYYLCNRIGEEFFGASGTALRFMAALWGVLTLVAMFLFVRILGETNTAALLVCACCSLSPFLIRYSQEARMYSMMTFLLLASYGSLLYALKSKKSRAWIFTVTFTIAGCLVHPLFLIAVAAMGLLAMLWKDGGAPRTQYIRNLIMITLVICIAVAAASPWLYTVLTTAEFTHHYTTFPLLASDRVKLWVPVLSSFFLELPDFKGSRHVGPLHWHMLLAFAAIASVAVMLKFGGSNERRAAVILFILPALVLIAFDCILGGSRSTIARYLMPLALGIPLALGLSFARVFATGKVRALVASAAGLLWACGAIASTLCIQRDSLGGKPGGAATEELPAIAAALSADSSLPVVVALDPYDLLPLTWLLPPELVIRYVKRFEPTRELAHDLKAHGYSSDFYLLSNPSAFNPDRTGSAEPLYAGTYFILSRRSLGMLER